MSGGGKLGRTETVTVRFDPKTNYLCELAARSQRRSKSSFIEWAVSEALKQFPELADLWDVDPKERFGVLVECAPHLLTFEEEQRAAEIWSADA